MSVICQTFVQNAWRKDLCSNCFKSKEEHEADGGGVGGRGTYRDDDGGSINTRGLNRGLDSGVGGGSKRYMGVAGSVYQRSYYNRNSWQSMMLDKSDSGLKSPGLIKGMSHLVSQENEKNLKLSDMIDSDDKLRSSRLVQCVKTSQSEAKLLTELLGDGLDDGRLTKEKKKEPDKPFLEDKGDVSSDLGSEASNDISSSSSASSSSYDNTCSPANSDTTSVKSDASSEQFEAEKEEFIGRDIKEENNDEELAEEAPPLSILKKAGDPKGTRGSINFRSTLEEVIGYGGDVDYSDDEDLLDDDDDDDDYDDFMELTPDERVLRRLTEKNTDFNSDNDNLKKDIEELLPSVKELEEKRKMIIAEIEELERLGRERSKNDNSKQLEEKKEEKPEGKVKLKRSPPLVTIKPLIARNHNEVRVNQVWPMKNGEIVRPVASNEVEEIPLKGIKPKYVAREEEMVEKVSSEDEMKTKSGKITSIDNVCNSSATKKEKVTSIDGICISDTNKKGTVTSIDVCGPVTDDTVKSAEVGLGEASAITRIDNLISQQDKPIGPQKPITKPVEVKNDHKAKSDIKTLPSISVMPRDSVESPNSDKGIKMTDPPQTESCHLVLPKKTTTAPEIKPQENIDTKELAKNAPVSAPRKSLLNSQEEKPKAPNDYKPVENLGKTSQQIVKSNCETSAKKVTEALGTERNENEKQDSRVSNGDINANKMVTGQKLNSPDALPSPDTLMPSKLISSDHEVLEVQTSKNLRVSCNIPDDKSINGHGEVEVPKTPENLKTPASRQGSTSSLFTTFGTPVISSTSQNSFLHSPSSRSMYDDVNSPSPMYTPASTDFLKEIKSQPEVPTPTAGIQKSALYASTSCLKGLPGAKPVITPKPPILKEKPKVPFKPAVSTSRIYASPSPIAKKTASSNLNGAVSTPNLFNNVEENCNTTNVIPNSPEPVSDSLYKVPPDLKKPPPTTQAPAIPVPSVNQKDEVVYDIPVTVASSQPNSSLNPPSASSPRNSKPTDDATIYQEIDDRLKTNRHLEESSDNLISHTSDSSSGSEQNCSLASVARIESTRCQSRSTFEANRSMLSAALDFGSSPLGSSGSKRLAPQPPAEDETNETEELPAEAAPVSLENSDGTENYIVNNQPTQDFSVPLDNNDGESYSSFTDDFDDDEEEEEEQAKLALRKAERSSSAIPFYRNSVGAIVTSDPQSSSTADPTGQESSLSSGIPPGWNYVTPGVGMFNKPLASRSHSVPRASEHMVITDPSPSATSAFSSKFSFGRSGFFRPSSPPTVKRDGGNTSDRARDRTKKSSSSRFSLKKFLRLGSKDDEKKNQKEQEKRLLRETKKSKLQIIHPLDYNQNGVEVIARPEKTSPIYDYTGIYGYIPPPRINNSKLEDVYASVSSVSQVPPVQASPAPSLSSKRSEISADSASPYSTSSSAELSSSTPAYAISSTFPTVSTKSSYASPISSVPQISSTSCSSSSVSNTSSSLTYSGGAYASVPVTQPGATSTSTLEKRNSFLRKETSLERCESSASYSSSINNLVSTTHHLGYNSEGRPKPPPPPRKGSLETSQPNEIYSSVADLTPPACLVSDSVASTEAQSRPQRPPPPTRTPSNAGSKSGPPRPDPPKLGRDSVYANLGDVRAPITPRKPGRSSSIRGDEDREKRRAPQPPSIPHVAQEAAQLATQRTIRHQHQDSTSSSCSSISSTNRASKGPAPPRPQQSQQNCDYDTLERNSASAANFNNMSRSSSPVLYDAPLPPGARSASPQDFHTPDGYIIPAQLPVLTRVTQIVVGSTSSTVMSQSRLDEVYQVPQNNSQTVDSASAPSLRQEKMGRLSVRRGSAVTHRSLEDQYGAVISANLEALSNMLDQLSNTCCPPGYEEVGRRVRHWEDIAMDDDIVVGAGHRLFYAGVAYSREITLMLTPETKVDAHHLLTPMPIVTFRDQIPTHLLSHKTIVRGKTSAGTVWVLPSLSLTTLKTLADESYPQLLKAPLDWERHTCLLLLQYVTGLKQLQAQGVEDTSIDLTLVARASELAGQDPDPRIMLVPPVEAGIPVMSLCECAAAATLMLMGVDSPLERAKDGNFCIPSAVPSQQAFSSLLKLLRQEKAGSLTQVKCVLEVLLFGPDSSGIEGESSEEVEAALQRWLDLERATVLHSLIRGPLESSILTKYHLLFLVRSNSKILRETMKFCEGKEELNC